MHRMYRPAALFPAFSAAFLLAAAAVPAADWSEQDLATAATLRDRAVAGTNAFDHVSGLVTEVGPRFAGSAGDAAAVRWALNRLGTLGFSNVRSQDVLVPRWVRGTAEVSIVAPYPQPLVAVAIGGSVGTPEEGIEAQVVTVGSLEALSALPANQVSGKIVFIDQRMERTRDASGYGAVVPNRSQGASVAANLGATALVIRSVGTSPDRVAHTGGLSYRTDAPRIPAFAISNPDADLLARQVKSGKPVRLRLRSTARELPPAWSANVIGEIPGSQSPNEVVLLGAHLDSWDVGPGAVDDGAGVAIVMEAARLIAKLDRKPARTIRVVLFANEEFGLSGGREYARLMSEEIPRHVIAFEADLGQGPVWRLQSRVGVEQLPAVAQMLQVLEPLKIEGGDNTASGGADLRPLREAGVPVLDLSLDATNYFDIHHTTNDTLAKIDPKILDQSVAAYAVAAWLASTKQGDFGRASQQTSAGSH
ncbi:Zn-dependent M28 family amino/carboxypeptidase [Povalibacter uvarum]|uniref:Carboxypeptidase Q n=2 Tax=Povalibacter uvarum TaxID=732238 RepID=A0A841HHM6_9GAMM|nr:Zn-dependent M28 family amino/carboxypeptidase [Povalibacter uvarum]